MFFFRNKGCLHCSSYFCVNYKVFINYTIKYFIIYLFLNRLILLRFNHFVLEVKQLGFKTKLCFLAINNNNTIAYQVIPILIVDKAYYSYVLPFC